MRLLLFALLAGCVSSSSVTCDDGRVCPTATQCDLAHQLCVTPDQLSQCEGRPDQTECVVPGQRGNCQQGVCLPIVCGNARTDLGETCDDGNTMAHDGCSADCTSTEACGNAVVDLEFHEACDDGGHVEHDGCSSACQLEAAAWRPLGNPPARGFGAAAFMANQQQIVVFGGFRIDSGVIVDDDEMWAWKGRWSRIPPALGPVPRIEAAMAYDAALGKAVMFGGAIQGALSDTWAWDGSTWSRLPDGPTLAGASMVYDARRKKLVVFGGYDPRQSEPEQNRTWELDGTAWTEVITATTPGPRFHAAMAYDPERGVTVLFGGHHDYYGPDGWNDTWEYDGTNWHAVAATTPPPLLEECGMAYDRVSHRMVLVGCSDESENSPKADTYFLSNGTAWSKLPTNVFTARLAPIFVEDGQGGLVMFGGDDGGNTPLAETWRWDGSSWTKQIIPTPRQNSAAAYDPERRRVILFGGLGPGPGFTPLGDTWELSQAGWRQFPATTATERHAMTYDVTHHEVLRFGGAVTAAFSNTVYAWNGSSWVVRAASNTPPSGRGAPVFIYDPGARKVLMFGGMQSTAPLYVGDTWSWDGASWTQLSPATSPAPRNQAAVGYDWVHKQVVMFGGYEGSPYGRDDTWIWNGTDWHEAVVPNALRPPARYGAALVWNPARERLVLTMGNSSRLDTWEWDGATWTEVLTLDSPRATLFGVMYPLLDGSGLSLIGGTAGTSASSENWQFAYEGARSSDACTVPSELDGDNLSACADPDCWVTCAPSCPPGTSCDQAFDRCGDGTCSAGETCHSCALDCTCTPVCGDFICDANETGCPGDCP